MKHTDKWNIKIVAELKRCLTKGMSDAEIAEQLFQMTDIDYSESSVRHKRIGLGLERGNIAGNRISKRRAKDIDTESLSEPTFDQKVERQKLADLKLRSEREEASLVRDEAHFQIMIDTIRAAIKPLEFIQYKYPEPKSRTNEEEEVVLDLSDIHIGKKTPTYNIKEACHRLQNVIDAVIKIVTIHRNAYPIKKLHIIWGGDILDGQGIFPTQAHHMDGHIIDQIFGAIPAIVQMLSQLACFFDEIHHNCVRGNHGRTGKFAHEEANFDMIFYHVLKIATANIPNMYWNIPFGWHCSFKVLNTKILAVHGHQIRMTMNLPWYGITTRISRWATTEGIEDFDVACVHHFHTSSHLRWNKKLIFTNGTMVTGDEFALEKMGLESSVRQWLFSIHPVRGITWTYEIDPLGPRKE